MPPNKGEEVAKKTAQEGLVEWKKGDGKKLLKKELWDVSSRYHSIDDPARDRTRDCIRATQYCGRTIEHAT